MNFNNFKWWQIGCLGFFAIIILQAFFPLFILGGICYGIYRLIAYDVRTRGISEWLNDMFDEDEEVTYLPEPEDELLTLKSKMDSLELENRRIRNEQKEQIKQALNAQKGNLLNEFFQNDTTDYKRSDEFEREENERNRTLKDDELRWRDMQQEMREKLFEGEKYSFETRKDLHHELSTFKEEVRTEFGRVFDNLQQLEQSVVTLRSYVDSRFNSFEVLFHQTLAQVRESIGNLRVELKDDVTNLRLEMGREVVNLHKQQ